MLATCPAPCDLCISATRCLPNKLRLLTKDGGVCTMTSEAFRAERTIDLFPPAVLEMLTHL